jgi:hypothetical protein
MVMKSDSASDIVKTGRLALYERQCPNWPAAHDGGETAVTSAGFPAATSQANQIFQLSTIFSYVVLLAANLPQRRGRTSGLLSPLFSLLQNHKNIESSD